MKTIIALNLKTMKPEKITSTEEKDIHGKVIWVDANGKEVELTTSRHFGKTRYYFQER